MHIERKEEYYVKLILHDLGEAFAELLTRKSDHMINANGKYAPCQGCFSCWTKHPAECFMKDELQQACRRLGQADELIIITKHLYGGYSTPVKNVLDRAIGTSTPFSTYPTGAGRCTIPCGTEGRVYGR